MSAFINALIGAYRTKPTSGIYFNVILKLATIKTRKAITTRHDKSTSETRRKKEKEICRFEEELTAEEVTHDMRKNILDIILSTLAAKMEPKGVECYDSAQELSGEQEDENIIDYESRR